MHAAPISAASRRSPTTSTFDALDFPLDFLMISLWNPCEFLMNPYVFIEEPSTRRAKYIYIWERVLKNTRAAASKDLTRSSRDLMRSSASVLENPRAAASKDWT